MVHLCIAIDKFFTQALAYLGCLHYLGLIILGGLMGAGRKNLEKKMKRKKAQAKKKAKIKAKINKKSN